MYKYINKHISYISEKISDCLGEVIKFHKISVVLINFQLDVLIQGFKAGYIFPVYCIILPRKRGKIIQLTTHLEWLVSSTYAIACISFSQAVANTWQSIIYWAKHLNRH